MTNLPLTNLPNPMISTSSGQVIITGAAGGMGQAISRRLASVGISLILIDHNQKRCQALAQELGAQHKWICVDLSDPNLINLVAAEITQAPLALINVAGISKGAPVSSLEDADWEQSFAVNVTAPMRLARYCLPLMMAKGEGSIVNIGSPVGLVGARKASYSASKAALHGLTMSLSREGGPRNVRVNTILPGPTSTYMTADWNEEKQIAIGSGTFLKRMCTPKEIAAVVAFLISSEASYITGSVIDMTAGSIYGH